MIKVLVVFGTRPEAIKMAPVIKALTEKRAVFEPIVCVTGQHREMLDQVLNLFDIVPDYDLDVMVHNQSLATLTANVLAKLDPILEQIRPDWVLVQGDTTTAMAASLAAFYRQVKVGHIEAGLRTDDKYQPFPEEINRRITSVVADIHFAPTEWAADNLRREGHPEHRILVTGNTVIDAVHSILEVPFDPANYFPDEIIRVDKRIVLVTAHRRENFGAGIRRICAAVKEITSRHEDIQVVYPVHLNPNISGPVHELLDSSERILLLPPLEYQPLLWLMKHSYLILSDSGGIQEEAPGMGKPLLVLRDTTERPEGVASGSVRLVGTDDQRIVAETSRLLTDSLAYGAMSSSRNPYGDGHASQAIVERLV